MSIYMPEDQFRDFLRRVVEVRHEPNGVVIALNTAEAKRILSRYDPNTERMLVADAMEFVRQTAQKVVAEVREGLKAGEPFPYPVDDWRQS